MRIVVTHRDIRMIIDAREIIVRHMLDVGNVRNIERTRIETIELSRRGDIAHIRSRS
jgi:hypothetical protein